MYNFEVVGIYGIGIDDSKYIKWMKSNVCDRQHNVMLVSLPSDQLATMPLLPGSSGTWFFFYLFWFFFIYDYVFRQLTEYGGTSTSYTQTKHEISLQQLLSPHGRRCRKVGVSFHVQAKHLRRIACFHKHKIKPKYVLIRLEMLSRTYISV